MKPLNHPRVAKVGRSAVFAFVIAVPPVIMGLMTTFYKADLVRAWPLIDWPGSEWTPVGPAIIFWGCLAIWPVMFICREYVKNRENESNKTQSQGRFADLQGRFDSLQREFDGLNKNIDKAVQAFPLGGFIRKFALAVCKSEDSLCSVAPRFAGATPDKSALVAILRELLSDIASIAAAYDGRGTIRYAANVMFFAENDNLQTYAKIPMLGGAHTNLEGALILQAAFSAEQDVPEKPDGLPSEVVLPVPKSTDSKSLLPGAPRVYRRAVSIKASQRMQTHGVDDIRTWDFATLGWTEAQVGDARDYYSDSGAGRAVRSFMSFPLFGQDTQAVIAVLNIHCNDSNWMNGDKEKKGNAVALLMALVNEVGRVVRLIR